MTLTPDEAADALRDIERTGRRSSTAYGYTIASPHLILWGVIWVIGYGASAVSLELSRYWPLLSLFGAAASFFIAWRTKPSGRTLDWRYFATLLAVLAFIGCTFAIWQPRDPLKVSAFFPILVALYYSLIGIWTRGLRILIGGAAIFVLTMLFYFWLPQHFLALMAVVGGGGLILGGIWLRGA